MWGQKRGGFAPHSAMWPAIAVQSPIAGIVSAIAVSWDTNVPMQIGSGSHNYHCKQEDPNRQEQYALAREVIPVKANQEPKIDYLSEEVCCHFASPASVQRQDRSCCLFHHLCFCAAPSGQKAMCMHACMSVGMAVSVGAFLELGAECMCAEMSSTNLPENAARLRRIQYHLLRLSVIVWK